MGSDFVGLAWIANVFLIGSENPFARSVNPCESVSVVRTIAQSSRFCFAFFFFFG